jgi:hypothetical protein
VTSACALLTDDAPGRKVPPLGINVYWMLSGDAVYRACQWAVLVVVARLGSPEKVGEFILGLATSDVVAGAPVNCLSARGSVAAGAGAS